MILNIDMTGKDLVVTQSPRPKLDQHGEPRKIKETGEPIWVTQVCVTDESGGEVININTNGGGPPDVEVGEVVVVENLVARPWATNGRGGVSYIADSLKSAPED